MSTAAAHWAIIVVTFPINNLHSNPTPLPVYLFILVNNVKAKGEYKIVCFFSKFDSSPLDCVLNLHYNHCSYSSVFRCTMGKSKSLVFFFRSLSITFVFLQQQFPRFCCNSDDLILSLNTQQSIQCSKLVIVPSSHFDSLESSVIFFRVIIVHCRHNNLATLLK